MTVNDDTNSEICSNSCTTPTNKRNFEDLECIGEAKELQTFEMSTSTKRKVIVKKEIEE